MTSKCLNYKFFILFFVPLVGILFSIYAIFAITTPARWGFLAVLILSALCAGILLFSEPIFYEINASGIRIVGLLHKHFFAWQDIYNVHIAFDTRFKFLFIRDYVLSVKSSPVCPENYLHIFKYTKTQKHLEKYGPPI